MDIDLLVDRVSVDFLIGNNFTLYELYDMYNKLKNLEGIKNELISNSEIMGLKESLPLHHNQLQEITKNAA